MYERSNCSWKTMFYAYLAENRRQKTGSMNYDWITMPPMGLGRHLTGDLSVLTGLAK